MFNGWTGQRVRHFNNLGDAKSFPLRAQFLKHASCDPTYAGWGDGNYDVEENTLAPVAFPFDPAITRAVAIYQEETLHWTHFDNSTREPGRDLWEPMVQQLGERFGTVSATMLWLARAGAHAFSSRRYLCISSARGWPPATATGLFTEFFVTHELCAGGESAEPLSTGRIDPPARVGSISAWKSGIARAQFFLTPAMLVVVRKHLAQLQLPAQYSVVFGTGHAAATTEAVVAVTEGEAPSGWRVVQPPQSAELEIVLLVMCAEAVSVAAGEDWHMDPTYKYAKLLRGEL
jgi:hypothetical protein